MSRTGAKTAPITVISLLEGAAAMMKVAQNIEDAATRSKESFVRIRKADLNGIATALRQSATMVDLLVCAVERGERFNENLPR